MGTARGQVQRGATGWDCPTRAPDATYSTCPGQLHPQASTQSQSPAGPINQVGCLPAPRRLRSTSESKCTTKLIRDARPQPIRTSSGYRAGCAIFDHSGSHHRVACFNTLRRSSGIQELSPKALLRDSCRLARTHLPGAPTWSAPQHAMGSDCSLRPPPQPPPPRAPLAPSLGQLSWR